MSWRVTLLSTSSTMVVRIASTDLRASSDNRVKSLAGIAPISAITSNPASSTRAVGTYRLSYPKMPTKSFGWYLGLPGKAKLYCGLPSDILGSFHIQYSYDKVPKPDLRVLKLYYC